MNRIVIWIKAIRATFFTASIVPPLLGGIIAWSEGSFIPLYFILAILGTVCVNGGINLVNDYFDFKSGIDINAIPTPFSGGSRMLPGGVLKPESVYLAGMVFFAVAAVIGIYLVVERGLFILLLGIIGIFSAYFYSQFLSKKGVGELTVGLDLGPLAVLGAYYVQVQKIALEPLVASIPVGILVAAILYINEFPDFEADRKAGRYHLVVRLGKKRAVKGYIALLAATYAWIAVAVLLRIIPTVALIALITLPIALKAIKVAKEHYEEIAPLIPAMASTVRIHLITGLLLCGSYIVKGIS